MEGGIPRTGEGEGAGGGGAKGKLGLPAIDGDQVIGWHRHSRDHRIPVQAGTQRRGRN